MSESTLSESRTFDRRLEFFDDNVRPGIVQSAFNHSPIAWIYFGRGLDEMFGTERMSGRGLKMEAGGNSIQVKHNLGKNTTAKWLTGPWDTVDPTPSDTVRHSRAERKHGSATVTISEEDRLLNRSSEEATADLINFEYTNAISSLADLAAAALYEGDGVTQFTGLQTLVSAGDTVQSLAGGTYPNWNSRGLSARGTAAASVSFAGGSFATTGFNNWHRTYLNASEGVIKPEVLLTTYDIFRFFHNSLQSQERFQNTNTASGGFESLAFLNRPVIPDDKCPSGETHFLNFTFSYFSALPGAFFDTLPFEMSSDQEARTSKIMLKGNQVVSARKFLNKTISQTA